MGSWIGNKIVRGLFAYVEGCWSASDHLVYNLGSVCEARILDLEGAATASGCCVGQTDQEDLLGDHHAHGMVYLDLGKVVGCSGSPFQIFRLGTAEDFSNEMENGKETSFDTRGHFELEDHPQAGEERVNEGEATLKVLR